MTQTTVLIDAHCVMCNGLARFLRTRAKPSAQLDIHGIESDEGQALIATFPARLQAMDTVYVVRDGVCLLYTSPSPRDQRGSRMPSSA